MNNATYLALLEEARWELLAQNGLDMKYFLKAQQGPVILDVTLKFLKELRLRETVKITCELLDYEGKIGHLIQKIIKSDGVVLPMLFSASAISTQKTAG